MRRTLPLPEPWSIRAAGRGDAALLAALGGRLFSETFGAENRPEDTDAYLAAHFSEDAVARTLAAPGASTLLLERAGEPAGWALLLRDGDALEIRRFYVDGRWHGSGAANALMDAAVERACASGVRRLWLAVWERNARARVFYEKHGFVPAGRQAFQYGADLQWDDVLERPPSFGLTLAIVAGGSARRMAGAAKPLLRVGRRTVLDRVLDLRTLADAVLLVSEDARLDVPGAARVPDALPGRGAPGGVHAALRASDSPRVLAVAGDMPFVDGRAVRPLLTALDAVTGSSAPQAAAYEVEGRLEPLLAVYARSAVGTFEDALALGPCSFRRIWSVLPHAVLEAEVLRDATGSLRAVANLNTAEDVRTWERPVRHGAEN